MSVVAAEVYEALRSLHGVWDEDLVDEFDHAAQAIARTAQRHAGHGRP